MRSAWRRRLLAMSPGERYYAFAKRAGQQSFLVACVLALLVLSETVLVEGQGFEPTSAVRNKRMHFSHANTEDGNYTVALSNNPFTSVLHTDFETGDVLDQSNPHYDERRWTFGYGVDLILRFDKGYTFCTSYVLVPAENAWPAGVRGLLYLVCLFYLFLGIAIISDIFMGAIEEITSEKEKIVLERRKDGTTHEKVILYAVWNETVANLTLLALGSSAPEIVLSVIETLQNLDKVPGKLGPGTIVGSAAFNLLVITAVCMWNVEEVKKVKEFGVFLITAVTSLLAYFWMIVVLQLITPDVIEVWEALATLFFFPLLVGFAYCQDRNWFRKSDDEGEDGSVAETSSDAGDTESLEGVPKASSQLKIRSKDRTGDDDEDDEERVLGARVAPGGGGGGGGTEITSAASLEPGDELLRAAGGGSGGGGGVSAAHGSDDGQPVATTSSKEGATKEANTPPPLSPPPSGGSPRSPASDSNVGLIMPGAADTTTPTATSAARTTPPPPPAASLPPLRRRSTPQVSAPVPVFEATEGGGGEGGGDLPRSSSSRRRRSSKILNARILECSEDDVKKILASTTRSRGSLTENSLRDALEKNCEEGSPAADTPHPGKHRKCSRSEYKMQAFKQVLSKNAVLSTIEKMTQAGSKPAPTTIRKSRMESPEEGVAEFVTPSYTVLEGDGVVTLSVRRVHGQCGALAVRYNTVDLTAIGGTHYEKCEGTLQFSSEDRADKALKIKIYDDTEHNADRLFLVQLHAAADHTPATVGELSTALVTIVDDDLPGQIRFKDTPVIVKETEGVVKVDVIRDNGSSGTIFVQYRTDDGIGDEAAVSPDDYQGVFGEIAFRPGECHHVVEVPIVDRRTLKRRDHFFVTLTAAEGKTGGKLGHLLKTRVEIVHDECIQELVETVMTHVKEENVNICEQETYGNRFRAAMHIGGEGDEAPSNFDYLMHFLTFLWKVLFATVPPAHFFGGWPAFCVSLFYIGLVTAMVAEVATLIGCVLKLKDTVTAITLVALGTSLPDTFASMQAADNEDTADAAIGNVTGSNSVNVFLGLGLPWTIASIYYAAKGECYLVPAKTLGYSVMVFLIVAVVAVVILLALRAYQGGELGGKHRKPVAVFLFFLWFLYILLSGLQAYDHIPPLPGSDDRCPCGCSNRGVLPWTTEPITVTGSCLAEGCPV